MTNPTPGQLRFLDWEMGAFFHFGIRSFFLGHEDWDGKPMPTEAFMPDALDCGQWLAAARDMGAAYAIMTCKHHDGFALWPSKYTGYSVAASPYRGGKGDVVRAFTDACRQYGLKVGLYYSPAQWGGETSFDNALAYDDYFIGQLGELLTGYGKIDYLWLDGCGSEGHDYDYHRVLAAVRRMQPGILTMGGVLREGSDVRWIGNEEGVAGLPNLNTVKDGECVIAGKDGAVSPRFMPGECDMRLRSTWFDCLENEDTLATPQELFGKYEASVGRGANLLINAGPNRHGLLNDSDAAAMRGLGALIRETYGAPLPYGPLLRENGLYAIERAPGGPERAPLVNRVVLSEDLTQGEHITGFRIYVRLVSAQGCRVCVYEGSAVGHKRICLIPAIAAPRIEAEVLSADGSARLKDIRAYYRA